MGLIYTLFTPNPVLGLDGKKCLSPKGFRTFLGPLAYTKFHLIYTLFTPIATAFPVGSVAREGLPEGVPEKVPCVRVGENRKESPGMERGRAVGVCPGI